MFLKRNNNLAKTDKRHNQVYTAPENFCGILDFINNILKRGKEK